MRLYCVRHGQPEPATADLADPGLSTQGRQSVESMAAFLSERLRPITFVCTSPKQRTKETATIFHDALDVTDSLKEMNDLRPSQSAESVAELAWTWQEDRLLVGHNPMMGELVSQLILGSTGQEIVRFTPGTMVCLERQQSGNWILNWVMRPELLAHFK